MSKWQEIVAGVDDDYLIGLSNKGVVKRAYKDREQTECRVLETSEDGADVKVGEETCRVRIPLGESSCSCQSRSICRHVVLAILTVKDACSSGGDGNGLGEEEGKEEGQEERQEEGQEKRTAREQERTAKGQERTAKGQERTAEGQEGTAKRQEISTERGSNQEERKEGEDKQERIEAAFPQIEAYPLERLIKTLGSRRYQVFINKVKSGWKPEIQRTSIITVKFPDTAITVKLLEPAAYSTCTCHKKDLCEHKAEAILWYQLQMGLLNEKNLTQKLEEPQKMDLNQMKAAAKQMASFIESQMALGLSRASQDVVDAMERMAVISHNQGLAECERQFRALAQSYQQYFKRMASFREEDLLVQMMRLYCRISLLSQVDNAGEALRLAGEFKSEYQPVGELYLLGIGTRYFKSKSGYEGETFYFLEERTGKWYTYTNARPVFYENNVRRMQLQKSQTPWNLSVEMQNLQSLRLHLLLAKANKRRRLSSSQETRAEVLGKRTLQWEVIKPWYYTDFKLLFQEQVKTYVPRWLPGSSGEEYGFDDSQSLVFIQAKTAGEAIFDTINQIFKLPLYDLGQRLVTVEVAYSKEEALTIRYLERIARRLQSNGREIPCFVGSVYLKDGEIKLYPITCLEQKELEIPEEGIPNGLEQTGEGDGKKEEKAEKAEKTVKAEKAEKADVQAVEAAGEKDTLPDSGTDKADVTDKAGKPEDSPAAGVKAPDKYEVMEQLSSQAMELLADVFQSGFDAVHESTLGEMQRFTTCAKQYGLHYLARQMEELSNQLKIQRHQMEHQYDDLMGLFEKLSQYLFFFRDELQKDRAGKEF